MENFKFWHKEKNNIDPQLTERIISMFDLHGLGNVSAIEDISKGCDQRVYLVTCQNISYIYKEPKEESIKLSNENYGCLKAKEVNVPAPTVLHCFDRYLIETVVKGSILSQIANKPTSIYEQLGRYLKQIHQIPVKYFGERGKSEYPTSYDLFNSYNHSEILEQLLNRNIFNSHDKDKIRMYFKEGKKYYDCSTSCLIHQDITEDNVMSDGKVITGIIDWSDLGGGYPEDDFYYMYVEHWNNDYYKSLIEGYGGINQAKVEYLVAIRLTWVINDLLQDNEVKYRDKYLTLYSKILGIVQPDLENIQSHTSPKPN